MDERKATTPDNEILRILSDFEPKVQNGILLNVKKELLRAREEQIKDAEERKAYLIDSVGGL